MSMPRPMRLKPRRGWLNTDPRPARKQAAATTPPATRIANTRIPPQFFVCVSFSVTSPLHALVRWHDVERASPPSPPARDQPAPPIADTAPRGRLSGSRSTVGGTRLLREVRPARAHTRGERFHLPQQ